MLLSLFLFALATISPVKTVCFFAWDIHVCLFCIASTIDRKISFLSFFFLLIMKTVLFLLILFDVVSYDSSFFLDFFSSLVYAMLFLFAVKARIHRYSRLLNKQTSSNESFLTTLSRSFFFFFLFYYVTLTTSIS